jgi:hypothetical protein
VVLQLSLFGVQICNNNLSGVVNGKTIVSEYKSTSFLAKVENTHCGNNGVSEFGMI